MTYIEKPLEQTIYVKTNIIRIEENCYSARPWTRSPNGEEGGKLTPSYGLAINKSAENKAFFPRIKHKEHKL